MKFSTLLSVSLFSLTTGVLAAPGALPQELAATSTSSKMARLQSLKLAERERQRKAGAFAKDKYENIGNRRAVNACTNGKVAGTYACSNVDMTGFLSHQALGSTTREGNDVWGWTSSTGREFGLVGQTDGTAFVEILSDGSLKYWGRLPTATVSSSWRDIKVIGDYAYIGSEARSHGLQIFDMKKLLTLTTAKAFSITTDVTARFTGFGNSHNIVMGADGKHVIAVGSSSCSGGLYFVNIENPAAPKNAGCASSDGYVHDAQCVIYTGPTTAYRGKEICFGFNEDSLTIYDVTSKSAPVIVSKTKYTGVAYTHQGWLANSAMTHLLLDDELDEMDGTAPGGNAKTTTYLWDITNLLKPVNTGAYKSQAKSIDHNQYVHEGLTYQANYGSGLRIVDVSSLAANPTGSTMKEVGYFDCYPEDDAAPKNEFHGTWSTYPYFKSGYVLLNSIERGIFALKYTGAKPRVQ